eukprot:CAMPEP_0181256728 /NCGR_PEP_ID=MMETSP1096-20121128/49866_1 /TAXON_ID=156174 ORGANISM="Chrysochromulina ericina, Strain CCMP281" /NCGR_SAMPLE_ID=MMETSP1096 /ASSEMBLY_ACC=CAM_ASM_000453 /LENGTH=114 /DNA_ID=CAMNT_0023354999 /DNA_START=1040 /DNA_END=1384 /DNA_ORIENTATION=+
MTTTWMISCSSTTVVKSCVFCTGVALPLAIIGWNSPGVTCTPRVALHPGGSRNSVNASRWTVVPVGNARLQPKSSSPFALFIGPAALGRGHGRNDADMVETASKGEGSDTFSFG